MNLYLGEYEDVRSPALFVPDSYKSMDIDQYKYGIDCKVYYVKEHYTYQKAKELSLKKVLGYDFLKRYGESYGVNLVAYLLSLSINIFLLINNVFTTLLVLLFIISLK